MSASRWADPGRGGHGFASAERLAFGLDAPEPRFLVWNACRIAGLFRSIGRGLCHGLASTLVAGPGPGITWLG
jgi:hypothetical protein